MALQEKVAVTGGSGFIGTHLCRALSDEGYDVVVVDTQSGVNILDITALEKAFAGATYVFHLAALPRVQYSIEYPKETHEVNVTGTLNVLLAAKKAGVKKVIYSASSSAYGDQDVMPLIETMRTSPKSPYALHKYIGEEYCKLFSEVYGLSTVSLRYFNVYGPGASAEGAYALVIAKFLKQRLEDMPMTITGDGTQTRDFTHVRDVVRANMLAATSEHVGRGEVINIGSGNAVSVNQIAKLIGGPVEYIPARLEVHDTRADWSLAKRLLGWEPTVSIEDGILELKTVHGVV